MDVIETIMTRRSIRTFTGEPISEEQLNTLLKVAFQAPSASNHQPWHFVVVRDSQMLSAIAAAHRYARMLRKAGCGIVVCGDKELQKMTGFLVEECSATIENMLLAAHGIGLGAVWCGLYPSVQLSAPIIKLLNLPENIIPVGLVVVGRKAEENPFENRYNPERIHHETW